MLLAEPERISIIVKLLLYHDFRKSGCSWHFDYYRDYSMLRRRLHNFDNNMHVYDSMCIQIICIDELDKMPKQFQDKLLNFMVSPRGN
jgi:hypothetical protein